MDASFPWKRDPTYGFFEYACHEGNYSLFNILSGARADEEARAAIGGPQPISSPPYLPRQMDYYKMFIDGHWADAASGDHFESDNPYPGQAVGADPARQRRRRRSRGARGAQGVHLGRVAEADADARGALLRKLGDLVAENVAGSRRDRGARTTASSSPRWARRPRTWRSGITTTAGSRTRSKARCCRSTSPTPSTTRATSRSAWSPRSCRGTRRCC